MDIYLLNLNFERIYLIDVVDSFIWTERYNDFGDFEMIVPKSTVTRFFNSGLYVSIPESETIMVIEKVVDSTDSEGIHTVTVSGRSFDSILERRIVQPPQGSPHVKYSGRIGVVIQAVIADAFMYGGNLYPEFDTVDNFYITDRTTSTEIIQTAIKPQSVYEAVKNLCDSRNFAFGMELHETDPQMYFYVYEGVDRTNVFFSTQLDTLAEESQIRSTEDYFNVAYLYSKDGAVRGSAYLGPAGYDIHRRILAVTADDLEVNEDNTIDDVYEMLKQRGREELVKHKRKQVFDGVLTGLDPYRYGTHYKLGDIVYLLSDEGITTPVRMAEYIWALDEEGLRAYPAFEQIEEDS